MSSLTNRTVPALVIDAEDVEAVKKMDAALPDVPLAEQPADREFTTAELQVIFMATQQLATQIGAVMLRPNVARELAAIAGTARTAANLCRRRLMRAGHGDPKGRLEL